MYPPHLHRSCLIWFLTQPFSRAICSERFSLHSGEQHLFVPGKTTPHTIHECVSFFLGYLEFEYFAEHDFEQNLLCLSFT